MFVFMLGTLANFVFYQCFYVAYYSLHFVEVSDYKYINKKQTNIMFCDLCIKHEMKMC